MHSLSSSRQDTQVSSWPHKTFSLNSFPPHPFAFPLVSSLAFTASFLPSVFNSIFSMLCCGKYLVLQPRFYRLPRVRRSVRSHIFSRSVFSVLFPFYLQYFLSYILCFGRFLFSMLSLLLFSCSRSRDFSLTRGA